MSAAPPVASPAACPAGTLHRRIRRDIEDAILSGRWPPGHRVPFEHELAAAYGCSRMTVNKVMTDLARAGLIARKRRAGSVVSRPASQQALLRIPDLRTEVEARGEAYGYALLSRARRPAGPADAGRLGVATRTPVLALACLHSAAGRPFALEDRLVDLAEIPEARDQDFAATPPGTWLTAQVPWTEAEHRISARGADEATAARLGIAPGQACLVLERRTWRAGRAVTAVTLVHPGHLHALSARFAPAAGPVVPQETTT